jgi:chemotaxis protein CheX
MNVKFLNPFVEAAYTVFEAEVGLTAQRGDLALQRSACTASDVTVLISMLGQVQGVVLYGLSESTAISIVSKILGQPFEEFDELAQSGIGELGNVITGQASNRLAEAGLDAKISPPSLILGKGTLISTLDFDRLLVPLYTDLGEIQIHLALRETQGNSHPDRQVAAMTGAGA